MALFLSPCQMLKPLIAYESAISFIAPQNIEDYCLLPRNLLTHTATLAFFGLALAACTGSDKPEPLATVRGDDTVYRPFLLHDGSTFTPAIAASVKPSQDTCDKLPEEQARVEAITGKSDEEIKAFTAKGKEAVPMLYYASGLAETAIYCALRKDA